MNDFSIWFLAGLEHILELGAYDHFLFIVLVFFAVPHNQWIKVVYLLLGFTLGHSLSLAYTAVKGPIFSSELTEVLIALTIILTALYQVLNRKKTQSENYILMLCTVTFFGMVHGLGFSASLRSLLGTEESLLMPLLYFNVGLEAGQLIIVLAVLLFSVFLANTFKINPQHIKFFFACLSLIVSLSVFFIRLQHLLSL